MPRLVRVQPGVAQIDDEWHVVVAFDGDITVYDPPFTTEYEALCAADKVNEAIRALGGASA